MRVFDLVGKDLSQLLRDWKTALFLLIMPIGFTLLFAFAFSGLGGGEEDPRLPVGYLDLDGSATSAHLVGMLADSAAIAAQELTLEGDVARDLEGAAASVTGGDLAAAVVIPAGYGAALLDPAGVAAPALQVIADTASNAGRTAENAVLTAAARMASAAQAAHLSAQAYEAEGGAADGVYRAQALSRAVAAWQHPPLSVTSTASGVVEQGDAPQAEESPYAHASAGIMVQFAMAGLIGAAEIMVVERKSGALRRMLTTPIARWQIILGHFVTMVIMILAQLLILAVFGQLALGVDYSRAPGAIGTMIITTALWSASLGLLIGTFSKSEEQVAMFTIVPMLILSGLGGAWMPLEFTGEAFQAVGHVTPVAWAIDGFENVVIRGMGIGSIWVPAAILLLYTTAFIAIAAWRFRFE